MTVDDCLWIDGYKEVWLGYPFPLDRVERAFVFGRLVGGWITDLTDVETMVMVLAVRGGGCMKMKKVEWLE